MGSQDKLKLDGTDGFSRYIVWTEACSTFQLMFGFFFGFLEAQNIVFFFHKVAQKLHSETARLDQMQSEV